MKIKMALLLMFALWPSPTAQAQDAHTTAAKPYAHHLMPVPMAVEFQAGRLRLSSSFTYAITGYREARLQNYLERVLRRLEGRTGLTFKRGAASEVAAATLTIDCAGAGLEIPALDENESYALNVDDQHLALRAATTVGAMRGLETFLQLLDADRDGYFFPAVKITDQPRFPWRGLLIDVCRHWQPVEVIKRNIDGLAAMKMNVLHWHLSEDQGFRVEVKKYPKLQQMGSDGLYYTQEQIREVVAYACERGIRVVAEFDMPGHATSWLVGYPELASAPGPYTIERRFGIFDGTLDPTRDATYKFLDNFFKEMTALFPDAYLHIGGDENNGVQWSKNAKIVAFRKAKKLADNEALQAYFNQRVLKILTKYKKKMVGWDEILHPDLPTDIVVQSWRGKKSLAEGAKKGYRGILSNGYYLDHIRSAEYHYANDPIDEASGLSVAEAQRVLGGEACMWGEHVSPETIDSRIWPRLGAVAERLWSPREVKDASDMYRRLAIISTQLEELGLLHQKNAGFMMRRLAAGKHLEPLKTLLEVIEPVDFSTRSNTPPPTTQETPLTRLVDLARPDNHNRREIAALIDELLADAPRFAAGREKALRLFTGWRDGYPAFLALSNESPIVQEAEPLAKQLAQIGAAGLEALAYLHARVAAPAAWRDAKLALLEPEAKPKSKVRIVIFLAMKELIIAAAELSQLPTMTKADWHKQVKALAAEKKK
ncbi:MAG: family 20 glycosylhydrolase [Acidobacteria bacterium]|nr:family 20 glycosylhydrolase [Acidobacteriota bacterium]